MMRHGQGLSYVITIQESRAVFKMAVLHFAITRGNFGERLNLACAICTGLQYTEQDYTNTPEF